jgi:hypothetical protein
MYILTVGGAGMSALADFTTYDNITLGRWYSKKYKHWVAFHAIIIKSPFIQSVHWILNQNVNE